MDFDSVYIKMCEQADIKELELSNYPESMKPCFTYHESDVWFHPKGNHPAIKLFRQDELQEMVWEDFMQKSSIKAYTSHMKLIDLSNWILDFLQKSNKLQFQSMEQLWLAFVMEEKYGKIWNGNDWVLEKVIAGS